MLNCSYATWLTLKCIAQRFDPLRFAINTEILRSVYRYPYSLSFFLLASNLSIREHEAHNASRASVLLVGVGLVGAGVGNVLKSVALELDAERHGLACNQSKGVI